MSHQLHIKEQAQPHLINSNTHLKIQLKCEFIEMLLYMVGCSEFQVKTNVSVSY